MGERPHRVRGGVRVTAPPFGHGCLPGAAERAVGGASDDTHLRGGATSRVKLRTGHVVFEPPIMAGIEAALAAIERFAKESREEFA